MSLPGEVHLPAADLVVPVVLDVRPASAHYGTELTLTNRGATAARLLLTCRDSLGAAEGMVSEDLPAATQVSVPDAIPLLAARGVVFPPLAEEALHAGTLRIAVPAESASTFSVLARTSSPTSAPHPAGASGLACAGVSPAASLTG